MMNYAHALKTKNFFLDRFEKDPVFDLESDDEDGEVPVPKTMDDKDLELLMEAEKVLHDRALEQMDTPQPKKNLKPTQIDEMEATTANLESLGKIKLKRLVEIVDEPPKKAHSTLCPSMNVNNDPKCRIPDCNYAHSYKDLKICRHGPNCRLVKQGTMKGYYMNAKPKKICRSKHPQEDQTSFEYRLGKTFRRELEISREKNVIEIIKALKEQNLLKGKVITIV